MGAATRETRRFSVLANVRCLECGEVYAKPSAGGIVNANPGCPGCGYVGWIPVRVPEPEAPRRSDAGRLLLLPLQSH